MVAVGVGVAGAIVDRKTRQQEEQQYEARARWRPAGRRTADRQRRAWARSPGCQKRNPGLHATIARRLTGRGWRGHGDGQPGRPRSARSCIACSIGNARPAPCCGRSSRSVVSCASQRRWRRCRSSLGCDLQTRRSAAAGRLAGMPRSLDWRRDRPQQHRTACTTRKAATPGASRPINAGSASVRS